MCTLLTFLEIVLFSLKETVCFAVISAIETAITSKVNSFYWDTHESSNELFLVGVGEPSRRIN